MRRWTMRIFAVAAAVLLLSACAAAEGVISTTVVMRVSKMTQSAVVNVGEDLSMEVNIDGVSPASYQWYFNDAPIPGAVQKVYNIVNAQTDDAGVYRMDALSAENKVLLSMDISARVIEDAVPKSGDDSLPLGVAVGGLFAAMAGILFSKHIFKRKITAR